MKYTNILIALLCCITMACSNTANNQGNEAENNSSDDSIKHSEEKTSPERATKTSPTMTMEEILSSLPTEWQEVTNYAEEFVFMDYCDAAIAQVQLRKEGESWQLIHTMGQDAELFTIKNVERREEGYKDEVEVYYTFTVGSNNSEPFNMNLRYNDGDSLAGWVLKQGERPSLFAPKAHYNKYPTVLSELCVDCFEECHETENQLFGKGVVVFSSFINKPLHLYNTPTVNHPARTIILKDYTGPDSPQNDYSKWFDPFMLVTDYEIFHLICVGEEAKRYEVIVSRKPYRTMWVAKSSGSELLSWKDYMKRAVAVEPDKTHPQKVLDKPNGQPIDMNADCLTVLDMEGDWIKVGIHTELCENNTNQQGWLRWRQNDKHLLYIAWVM